MNILRMESKSLSIWASYSVSKHYLPYNADRYMFTTGSTSLLIVNKIESSYTLSLSLFPIKLYNLLWLTMYFIIDIDSYMYLPSLYSNTGNLPKGFFSKNSLSYSFFTDVSTNLTLIPHNSLSTNILLLLQSYYANKFISRYYR